YDVRLCADNFLDIIDGYDVIVDGTDNFPTRYLVTDASLLKRIPVVHGGIFRLEGQATVFAPYQGPCYRCMIPEPPPAELAPSCAEAGVLGVLPGIIGSIQAMEAIKLRPVDRPRDLEGWDPDSQLGEPGKPPYTRGIRPDMYRGRLWTMRQYAGFGTAEATNARFKFLLGAGQTGLSCAFDLPTQMGYDSDHPRAEGEVGKVGVAIDSIEDMRLLLHDLPLDQVTTSMTINSTAAILLLLYELVAEEQGVPSTAIAGTIQNDLLKEYIARGTYVYPPRPSMRLITDIFAYCRERVPKWNTISISGYHIREAGSTAVQEIA